MTTIHINSRGSMTLPKAMRKTLGIEAGGVVVAEATEEGIVLKPGVTFPVEIYSEERIKEFDKADAELGKYLKRK